MIPVNLDVRVRIRPSIPPLGTFWHVGFVYINGIKLRRFTVYGIHTLLETISQAVKDTSK